MFETDTYLFIFYNLHFTDHILTLLKYLDTLDLYEFKKKYFNINVGRKLEMF